MHSSRFSIRAVFGLCLALICSAAALHATTASYVFKGTNGADTFEANVTLDVDAVPSFIYDPIFRDYDGSAIISASVVVKNQNGTVLKSLNHTTGNWGIVEIYRTSGYAHFYVGFDESDGRTYFYGYSQDENLVPSLSIPNGPVGPLTGGYYSIDAANYSQQWNGSVTSIEFGSGNANYLAQIAQLQADLAAADALVASLQAQLANANANSNNLATQLATANSFVSSLQTQLSDALAANGTLSADNAALTAQVASLTQQISDLNAQIAQLTAQVAALTTERDALLANVAGLQASLAAAQSQIQQISTQLDAASAANAALTAQNASLSSSLLACQAHAADLQASLATANAANATLTAQLSAANAQITALNAANATLTANLATAQGQVATLTSANAALSANLAGSQAQVATLQALVASLNLSVVADVLKAEMKDPSFTIPGTTPTQQLQALVAAINGLNHGQQQALYKNLGGTKK